MSRYEIWDLETGNYLETCESKGDMEEVLDQYVLSGYDRESIGVQEIKDDG